MINPWKFYPWTHYNSKVIEIWKFDRNGRSRVKSAILNLTFSVITIVIVILSSWNLIWVTFFEVRNPKITLRRLKIEPVFRYLRFQVLGTCDQTHGKEYMWPEDHWKKNFFLFNKYQPMIEPKMAFGSLLGSSRWCYKFWSFLSTRNLIIYYIIVYSQRNKQLRLIDKKQPNMIL